MSAPISDLRFDSWGEYVDRSERPASCDLGQSSRDREDPAWSGTRTHAEAVELARTGWADGAYRLESLSATLTGKLANVSAVKRIGFDVMGPGTLDVGRYLIGHPEAMMVWQPSEDLQGANPDRIVRILVHGGASCAQAKETIFWRGAAAFAIADLIEASGARAEIELVQYDKSSVGAGAGYAVRRVMLKRAQDPAPAEILAYALCHAASLRRIDFGVSETLPRKIRTAMGYGDKGPVHGYGHPVNLPSVETDGLVYIPALIGGNPGPFTNAQTTAAWIVDVLREQGIEVEPM